jgi:ABC-type antimicrobial peptide transport system permease subunit
MISKLEKFDLLIKDLNDQQRAAVNENKNTVVTSGAGSGKTTVLSYRFLRLVIEEKANVDEILTLTFTRLAASEMFFRIQKNLVAFNEYDEIREQVALFSEATISTIDSFCSQVVGNDLKRYGLSDQYVLDDEANFQLAVECALEVVDKFSDDEGLLFLATMYSPDELVEQLLAKIAVSTFYLNQPYDPLKNTNFIIEKIKDSYANSIDHLIKQLMSLTAIQGRGKVYLDNLELANNLLNSAPQLLDLSNLEKTFLLLDGVNFKRTTVKDEFAQLFNEIVEEIRKTTLPLVKSCALALIESDKLLPIFQILKEMHSLYLTRKREAQLLTFNDISHMALDILLNNKKIRTYYKNKFKYILVDEFQDTNQLQKDLIYLLAEKKELYSNSIPHPSTLVEDKLFFVGDEKQSIYRFRKADVRVFKKLSSEIESSGGQVSIAIGFIGTVTSVLIGVVLGALAGYLGGKVDYIIMRVVDIMYGLPYMLLVIIAMAIFGRNILNLFFALAIISWLTVSRMVRGQIMSLKNQEFIEAARSMGAPTWRIIFRHLVPNSLSVIIVFSTLRIPSFIMTESFLSFLGLGVQAPYASWGSLVGDSVSGMTHYPWRLFFPAIAMTLFLFAMNFLGDGLRDAFDPQSKNQL